MSLKSIQPILIVIFLLAFFTCNGQSKTGLPGKGTGKTQGTGISKASGNQPAGDLFLSKEAYGQIIKCGIRDKKGNLWFGTSWAGVYRYDGKTFTRFSKKEGLCSNEVNAICEDQAGMLWFGTPNGVCRFDGRCFTTFQLPATDLSKTFAVGITDQKRSELAVHSILQDKAGNMWFGIWGKGGAYRYDGKKFTHFLPGESIQGIVEDNAGGIWLNSKRYDGKTMTDLSGKPGAFRAPVFCSLKDRNGNTWFGVRDNGLYRYDGKAFSRFLVRDGLFDNRVSCIFQDKTGKLWIGSDVTYGKIKGQLFRYDGKSFTLIPQIEDLGLYAVWTAVEDKNGNIWFGGRGGKLCRFNGKNFTDFSDKLAGNI